MKICQALAIILMSFMLSSSPVFAQPYLPQNPSEQVCPNNMAPRGGKCVVGRSSSPYGVPSGGGGGSGGGGLLGVIGNVVGGLTGGLL